MLSNAIASIGAFTRAAIARLVPLALGIHMILGTATEVAIAGMLLLMAAGMSGLMRIYSWRHSKETEMRRSRMRAL